MSTPTPGASLDAELAADEAQLAKLQAAESGDAAAIAALQAAAGSGAPSPAPVPPASSGPTGPSLPYRLAYSEGFTGPLDRAKWLNDRWFDPSADPNESTNNPGLQLDTSLASNVATTPRGLEMSVCPQVDQSQAARFPYCGSHLLGLFPISVPGSVVECDVAAYNLGTGWLGIVLYGDGYEVDLAEWGNTAQSGRPTFNDHEADYSAQTGPTPYFASASLLGGQPHRFTFERPQGSDLTTLYVDGKQAAPSVKLYNPTTRFVFSLEVGVAKPGPISSGVAMRMTGLRQYLA